MGNDMRCIWGEEDILGTGSMEGVWICGGRCVFTIECA